MILIFLDFPCITFRCIQQGEADDGYVGEAPLCVRCPACVTMPKEWQQMMNKDRVHQNNQQEIQAILDFKAGICHDIRVHHDVFPSISVIS